MGGSIFSAGSLVGDSALNGQDSALYTPDVFYSSGPDNSNYTDEGQDPTGGSGGNFLGTLDAVVNDAFKAYTISQTPAQYRTISPQSPAALQARANAQSNVNTATLLKIGLIIAVAIGIYLIVKAVK